MKTHGMTNTPEFKSWMSMKGRCKNRKAYKHIKVCPEWLHSFEQFYLDMGNRPEPKEKYSIERVDNLGDYHVDNCIWATYTTQNRNKKSNIKVQLKGEEMCLLQACKILGVNYTGIYGKMIKGVDFDTAVSEFKPKPHRIFTVNGVTTTLRSHCKRYGVSQTTVSANLKKGWTIEKSLSHNPKKKDLGLKARCRAAGVNYSTYLNRVRLHGYTPEEALNTPVKKVRVGG